MSRLVLLAVLVVVASSLMFYFVVFVSVFLLLLRPLPKDDEFQPIYDQYGWFWVGFFILIGSFRKPRRQRQREHY